MVKSTINLKGSFGRMAGEPVEAETPSLAGQGAASVIEAVAGVSAADLRAEREQDEALAQDIRALMDNDASDSLRSLSGAGSARGQMAAEEKRRKEEQAYQRTLDALREIARLREQLAQIEAEMHDIEESALGAEFVKKRPGETDEQHRARIKRGMEDAARDGKISQAEYDRWRELHRQKQDIMREIAAKEKEVKGYNAEYGTIDRIRREQREGLERRGELDRRSQSNDSILLRLRALRGEGRDDEPESAARDDTAQDIALAQILQERPDVAQAIARQENTPGASPMTTEEKIVAAQQIVQTDQAETVREQAVVEADVETLSVPIPEAVNNDYANNMGLSSETEERVETTASLGVAKLSLSGLS